MDILEIYENLCSKDKRNPLYVELFDEDDEDIPQPRIDCSCDNCFYGKDKLAIELLKYINK